MIKENGSKSMFNVKINAENLKMNIARNYHENCYCTNYNCRPVIKKCAFAALFNAREKWEET